ncbi:MAG: hypothetical protein LBQ98_03700 [Nitrososphaerota archaeon]|jgi:hypothetical protein|nr:hypothetical protein [Nitrososphaerota archaeon]
MKQAQLNNNIIQQTITNNSITVIKLKTTILPISNSSTTNNKDNVTQKRTMLPAINMGYQ